jgi:hexosaminidase
MDVINAIGWHAFRDPSGAMGRVAYDLGNVYRALGVEPDNSSALFRILQRPMDRVRADYADVSPATFHNTLQAIDRVMQPLADARIARPDAGLIAQEFTLAARLMRHACRRGLLAHEADSAIAAALRRELDRDMSEFIAEYQQAWLARNRPGGLVDSVARLEKVREDYG